jgi:hypothetical protein|tara:strand:- start:1805 stop:2389 length:585 start_codon:yes stop_codon:yes gene_type:complete
MNILIENMIYGSIGLLFALAVLTVYALIQLGKNNVLTFFLIPLALVASIYTGYTLFALQGTPINDLPEGEVQVLWVEVQKPKIYFLVRHLGKTEPTYYTIPYSDDNAKEMDRMLKAMQRGIKMEGEFKERDPDGGDLSMQHKNIKFDNIVRYPLPPKKEELENQGVDRRLINEIQNQPDRGENTSRDYNDDEEH